MEDRPSPNDVSVKKRQTVDALNRDLNHGKFETKEERELIEATLEGKNRDIVLLYSLMLLL